MIALTTQVKAHVSNQTSRAFEAILPSIERTADHAFRRFPRWRRLELVSDVVAAAYTAFVRLIERGLEALIFPSVLAKYAIRHVRAGRRVGMKQNVHDVLSPYAQRNKGFAVEQLPKACIDNAWVEVTEDRKANPADVAALRVDLQNWLVRLKRFKRQVALRLAIGDKPSEVAQYFRLSTGRISQLREELRADWDQFQAEPAAA